MITHKKKKTQSMWPDRVSNLIPQSDALHSLAAKCQDVLLQTTMARILQIKLLTVDTVDCLSLSCASNLCENFFKFFLIS